MNSDIRPEVQTCRWNFGKTILNSSDEVNAYHFSYSPQTIYTRGLVLIVSCQKGNESTFSKKDVKFSPKQWGARNFIWSSDRYRDVMNYLVRERQAGIRICVRLFKNCKRDLPAMIRSIPIHWDSISWERKEYIPEFKFPEGVESPEEY